MSAESRQAARKEKSEDKVVPVDMVRGPVEVLSEEIREAVQIRQGGREHGEETFLRSKREAVRRTPAAHDMGLNVHLRHLAWDWIRN